VCLFNLQLSRRKRGRWRCKERGGFVLPQRLTQDFYLLSPCSPPPGRIGVTQDVIDKKLTSSRCRPRHPQATNLLTGSIPNFSSESSLAYVDLSHNRLNSTIPETWLDNLRLRYFAAGFNQLQGEIPGPVLDGNRLLDGWPTDCRSSPLSPRPSALPPPFSYPTSCRKEGFHSVDG